VGINHVLYLDMNILC